MAVKHDLEKLLSLLGDLRSTPTERAHIARQVMNNYPEHRPIPVSFDVVEALLNAAGFGGSFAVAPRWSRS